MTYSVVVFRTLSEALFESSLALPLFIFFFIYFFFPRGVKLLSPHPTPSFLWDWGQLGFNNWDRVGFIAFYHVHDKIMYHQYTHLTISPVCTTCVCCKFYVAWFYKVCQKKIQVFLQLGKNYRHITCRLPAETTVMDTNRYRFIAKSIDLVYFFMWFIWCINVENNNLGSQYLVYIKHSNITYM